MNSKSKNSPLYLILVSLLLFMIILTSCDILAEAAGLTKSTDVSIKSVTALKSGDNLTGVRVVFENNGTEDVDNVRYTLVISQDQTISLTNDFVCYESVVSISADSLKQIDIDGDDQIGPWVEANVSGGFDGSDLDGSLYYYLGVFIDSNDMIVEDNELNNEGVTTDSFLLGGDSDGGGSNDFSVSLDNAESYNGKKVIFDVHHQGDQSNVIAHGEEFINGGSSSAGAYDNWEFEDNHNYDVYIYIDMDGDQNYTQYIDLAFYDSSC